MTWLAAGRWDAIRGAVWGSDLRNPYRPEKTRAVELTREQSARIHAENVALLRAAGPR